MSRAALARVSRNGKYATANSKPGSETPHYRDLARAERFHTFLRSSCFLKNACSNSGRVNVSFPFNETENLTCHFEPELPPHGTVRSQRNNTHVYLNKYTLRLCCYFFRKQTSSKVIVRKPQSCRRYARVVLTTDSPVLSR